MSEICDTKHSIDFDAISELTCIKMTETYFIF